MVAEPSPITDSGHADWTNRVHVPFVQREVPTAEMAGGALGLAGRATRGAADYGSIVGVWSLDLEDGAA